MTEIDYSVRYGKNYRQRVCAAMHHHKRLNKGVCVCCLVRLAEEMHHTSYGNDKFAQNWFPVCIRCHDEFCHNQNNWVRLKGKSGVFGNHNTDEFVEKLRNNYKSLFFKKGG